MTLYIDNKVDGEALFDLTERALELLVPIIGDRMKFLKKLNRLKAGHHQQEAATVAAVPAPSNDVQVMEIDALEEGDRPANLAEQESVNRYT